MRSRTQWGMNDTASIESLVELVDTMVHAELSGTARCFRMAAARLYVVRADGEIRLVAEDENPYDLLVAHPREGTETAAVLVVTGWAAPLASNGLPTCRPSEHPARERIRLAIGVDGERIFTLMRRSGDPDVVLTMDERGVGDVPDALETWWSD